MEYCRAVKKCQNLTFKVNFLCQKSSDPSHFFTLKNTKLGTHFLLHTNIFWWNQFLNHFILKMMPYFWQLAINPKLKSSIISFGHADSYAKIFPILYFPLENSTTRIACVLRRIVPSECNGTHHFFPDKFGLFLLGGGVDCAHHLDFSLLRFLTFWRPCGKVCRGKPTGLWLLWENFVSSSTSTCIIVTLRSPSVAFVLYLKPFLFNLSKAVPFILGELRESTASIGGRKNCYWYMYDTLHLSF